MAVDDEKIKVVVAWPLPTTVKELRGFLGLTGYYRKFIAGYARIATPMTDQLSKDYFSWIKEATEAFMALKYALTNTPILALPNFSKVFSVETDASGTGLGAVLTQDGHPIAYYSQVLGVRNRLKSIYEKELMAIVLAVRKWRHYLMGRHFIIKTDQRSLKFLMEQREVGPKYQKWMYKLMGFDFEIHYKPGPTNKVADALSRRSDSNPELQVLYSTWSLPLEKLNEEIGDDPFIQQVKIDITEGNKSHFGYSVENNRFLYKGRLVIPHNSTLIPSL